MQSLLGLYEVSAAVHKLFAAGGLVGMGGVLIVGIRL